MFGNFTLIGKYLFKGFLLAVVALSLLLIVFGIVRAIRNRKIVKSVWKKIATGLLCLPLIVLIILNGFIFGLSNLLGIWFAGAPEKNAAILDAEARSLAVTEQITGEGIVLLKNQGGALPLDTASQPNVNVFGTGSIDAKYSNRVLGRATEKNPDLVPLRTGLSNAGFNVNQDLVQFYRDYVPTEATSSVFNLGGRKGEISEISAKDYSPELLQKAKDFSDVAVVVFGRSGGEGGDLSLDMGNSGGDAGKHYLELHQVELDLLDMVKENFGTVIVLINTANAMELGFLEDADIDAALWVGMPGDTGFNAVGKVLSGAVNPSGRLVDTWAYDATSSPAYLNSGNFIYSNTEHPSNTRDKGNEALSYYCYLNYAEGIYVGYKYYETAAADGYIDYAKTVQFPFGYGLSYTAFEQKISSYSDAGGAVSVDVTVTNTGSVPGKDVVQLYYTPPYTVGGIEKAHVNLAAFDKTRLLQPGESETLTLTVQIEEMASYDDKGAGCYVLEKGAYEIKLMNNAHDVIDSRTCTVSADVIYGENNPRSTDGMAAVNRFDDVSGGNGGVTYLSRADWAGTMPTGQPESMVAPQELINEIEDGTVSYNPNIPDIVVKNHGLKLSALTGLAYDDPLWSDFMEQVKVDQMVNLLGLGAWTTNAIPSLGIPTSECTDGPSGVVHYISGAVGTTFCSEVIIASTWDTDLAFAYGEAVGAEAAAAGYDGIYGPGMNIHRTPFSGRNFEYFSEDGFLSGKMGAKSAEGHAAEGVYAHIKHFALNDQETNRQGVCVWVNEQAMRELYFKPFELSIKEGGASAIMGSYNRIGAKWSGASRALNTEVLRNEWGFEGHIVTDLYSVYMNTDQAAYAGADMMESPTGNFVTKATTDTTGGRQALRTATKNVLYNIANSNAMEPNPNLGTNHWNVLALLIGVDLGLLGLCALGLWKATGKKKEKTAKA